MSGEKNARMSRRFNGKPESGGPVPKLPGTRLTRASGARPQTLLLGDGNLHHDQVVGDNLRLVSPTAQALVCDNRFPFITLQQVKCN